MTIRQSESLAALAPALVKFQSQVHGAKKNAQNPHLKNKYADLGAIWEAIREPLTDNGLSVVQLPTESEDGRLHLVTRLLHASGEWMESRLPMPVPKNDPQGVGSALSYARRYGLAAMLGIVQEDDDAEGAMKREAPRAQAERTRTPAPVTDPTLEAKSKKIGAAIKETNLSKETVVAMAARIFKGREITTAEDVKSKLTEAEVDQLIEEMRSPA